MNLALWLFLPVLLSASESEHFVNGALEPVTALSISEDFAPTLNMPLDCYDVEDEGEHHINIFLKNQSRLMTKVTTESIPDDKFIRGDFKPPEGIGGFLLTNISCIITMHYIRCTWNALNSPPEAQYSVTICQSKPPTVCHCDKRDGRVIGCHGNIEMKYLTLQINVSCENFWYIHSLIYDSKRIVKFNPPASISASIISGQLHIKWDPPILIPDSCLVYQLKLHEGIEPRNITRVREHNEPNIDVTKSHFVQMRVTKTSACVENIWSDWSPVVEVAPSEKPHGLNPVVIAAIALGIPMILLAVLLVCTCHSVMEKLFPIPSPSIKVKQLLERDCFMEILPAKSIDEEITEVSFVGNDECAKISA